MADAPTLVVEELRTWFETRAGTVKAVDGVSFSVEAGKVMGLVGESGSGKTVTGFSIMGLVDPTGRIAGGRILFGGRDLIGLPENEMRAIRGRRIAMIFQDPMMTLNPVLRIETQMVEAVLAHEKVGHAEARRRARATRSRRSASRARTSGSRPTRTSSPAACASGSRSRSRCSTASS